jgi:HSP20 family molecular chaperone IbpA
MQDIVDSGNAFTVTADAPGFEPNDVKIELKDGRITISGCRNEDKKQEQDGKVSSLRVAGF